MPKQNVHTGTSYEENTQIILIVNFIYVPNNNSIKKILNI